MLRRPKSAYVGTRTSALLKVKNTIDGEALVTGYEAGKGRHKGRTGALQCRMASGKRFKIGSGLSDADRDNPPAVGTIVSYRCQGTTDDGIPRFPVFLSIRIDLDAPSDPK